MRFFLTGICMFWLAAANAQKQGQDLIDSLVLEVPRAGNDTAKARLYKSIADKYIFINPAQARQYADSGLLLCQTMKWQRGIAVFHSIIATFFSDAGQYDSAISYNQVALNIHKNANDSFNIASTLNNMGVIRQRQSDYVEALALYTDLLKLAEARKDSNLIALAYANISGVYDIQKDHTKALDYSMRALNIRQQSKDLDEIANATVNVAVVYMNVPDSANAAQYLQKALLLYQQTGNAMGMGTAYTHMGVNARKNYVEKIDYYFKSLALWNDINLYHISAIAATGNIGRAYFEIATEYPNGFPQANQNIPAQKKQLLEKSVAYLKRAVMLCKETGNLGDAAFFSGSLAEAQALSGDYKNAYQNFNFYHDVQDSIYSQENKNRIAAIETERELTLKNREIEFGKSSLVQQTRLRWALIAGIVLLLCIALLLFQQSRTRKKNNQTLVLLNKELNAANALKTKFFGVLSHDLRSPIASLLSFLQLRKNNPGLLSPEKIAEHENRITGAAQSLLENMEEMLLWSKSQMEHFTPQFSEVEVKDLFDAIGKLYTLNDGIKLGFEFSPGLSIRTDADYLKTIMLNLTSNAVAATTQKDVAIIHWKAWCDQDYTWLSISDNGEGFQQEFIDSWNTHTTTIAGKKGLGMHIVKDMAAAIDCNITLKPGKAVDGNVLLQFKR